MHTVRETQEADEGSKNRRKTQDARRKIRVRCSELLLPARVAGAPSVRGLCVPRPATTAVCVEDVQIAQFLMGSL
jgi:hypothetical protein